MPDINVDVNYFEHFKTKRLIHKLGEEAPLIPIRLWIHAAKFSPETGEFKNTDASELFALAGIKCPKDPEEMMNTIINIGFMKKIKTGYKLTGWEEHQGHIVAYKIRGKHAAQRRWSKLKPKIQDIEVQPLNDEEVKEVWNET